MVQPPFVKIGFK